MANAVATGANVIRWAPPELDPFSLHVAELSAEVGRTHPNLVYLVSPNNPTGTVWSSADVRTLATQFPQSTFIVDEAYHEFAPEDAQSGEIDTCARLATQFTNVVVTRTFSKAFCLASVRCGYLIAHPNTIERLRLHFNPKSVNTFAQIAAEQALYAFDSYYRPYIKLINAERVKFLSELTRLGITAQSGGGETLPTLLSIFLHSHCHLQLRTGGNFVCVKVPSPRSICASLEEHEIFVRDISERFPGYIRITIAPDMSRVVDALRVLLQRQ